VSRIKPVNSNPESFNLCEYVNTMKTGTQGFFFQAISITLSQNGQIFMIDECSKNMKKAFAAIINIGP